LKVVSLDVADGWSLAELERQVERALAWSERRRRR
jgi:hypothetical protein